MDYNKLVTRKEIILDYNGLWDDDLDVIIKVLKDTQVLEELRLKFNEITLSSGKFAEALAYNRTLRVLHLDENNIGSLGAKQIANALRVNRTLHSLYLNHCKLGDEGGKHMARALMENKSIRVLWLDQNGIGDAGAQSLAASFVINQTLRDIRLNGNLIGKKGGNKLANALKCNGSIVKIGLEKNNVIRSEQARIQEILKDEKRGGGSNNDEMSPLERLEAFIETKDRELEKKDERIASLTADLVAKGCEV
mmetsp:Transcript_21645/g.32887  ORF Transcript_21645/g.32887 Transcript_21645/m.32887 type:complete len:251 (+) Transcript_21645:90-842(+)